MLDLKSNLYLFVLVLLLVLSGCTLKKIWKGYKPDNKVEEKIEEFIADKTGCDIDITPNSPEL